MTLERNICFTVLNMWMIPVLLVFLPLTNGFDKLILEPTNPFVFVGDCIVFTCKLNTTTLNDRPALHFSHNSIRFPQSEITYYKTYVTFKKCFESSREEGSYICQYSDLREFAGQWVKVEEKLVPIPKDSIKCIIFNWQVLNCTWSLGQKYIYMDNLSVNFCYAFSLGYEICEQASLTGKTLNRRKIDLKIPLNLTLTVHYRNKINNKTTYFYLNASTPIQPSSVKDVQLQFNDTCVFVEWKHRYDNNLHFHLIFEEMDSKKFNFSIKETKFHFCQLDPFMKYKLKIYALPKQKDGIYSEPYVSSFISRKSVPKHPPEIADGCFERDYSDVNSVTIFWKGLKRKEFGDEYVQYLIQNEDQNMTAYENKLKLKLSFSKNSCENISIWAKNSVGQSKYPSSIRICNKSKVPDYPWKIEAVIINSTTVLIKWERPQNKDTKVMGYTVYGCDRENCSSNFIWRCVSGNQTSKMLTMNRNVNFYTFAVSAENENGSSGLRWTECLFTLKKPNEPVRFNVKAEVHVVKVTWKHYNCYTEKAYITNYVVSYCVSLNNTNCQGKIQEKNVSKTEKKYVIKDLPKNDYLVWVKSSTSVGDSPVNKKPVQVYGQSISVVIVIVPIILLIFVIIGVLLYIKRSKMVIDKMLIEYPGKSENKYNSISSVMHVDSLSSCINDDTYDSASVLITAKLCSKASPEVDENQVYSPEKAMISNSTSENDFKNKDINIQDFQINTSKVQLPETVMHNKYKETDFNLDSKKQASSEESNEDPKTNHYIRAVPSFTCMNPHDKDEQSSCSFVDYVFEMNGKDDYISNFADIENICFGTKSYNCNNIDIIDKVVTQN